MAWVVAHMPRSFAGEPVAWVRLYAPGYDPAIDLTLDIGGKWMLFPSPGEFDRTWLAVAAALCEGRLGHQVKAPPTAPGRAAVIIVFTGSFRDRDAVLRIGLVLQRLFPPPGKTIVYKPNVFTDSPAGIHGGNSLPRSLYTLRRGEHTLTLTRTKFGESALKIAEQELRQMIGADGADDNCEGGGGGGATDPAPDTAATREALSGSPDANPTGATSSSMAATRESLFGSPGDAEEKTVAASPASTDAGPPGSPALI
jgi:hypothetical protein